MSRGDLQEMEVKTQQSKTAVNSGAKAGDPMDSSGSGTYEDLGGPTPENYKADDDSAKLREPKIKTVADVVNKGAKKADPMQKMSKEETETTEEVVAEEEVSTEEVVAESEQLKKHMTWMKMSMLSLVVKNSLRSSERKQRLSLKLL
jgi:23S rRNA A1618 N6-methylase RlmF